MEAFSMKRFPIKVSAAFSLPLPAFSLLNPNTTFLATPQPPACTPASEQSPFPHTGPTAVHNSRIIYCANQHPVQVLCFFYFAFLSCLHPFWSLFLLPTARLLPTLFLESSSSKLPFNLTWLCLCILLWVHNDLLCFMGTIRSQKSIIWKIMAF